MLSEKAPHPCCQENPRDYGEILVDPLRGARFQQWNSLGDGNGTRQGKQQVNVIRYASDRDRHHRVLARDPVQLSMQSIPHLFLDCRLSSAGTEHQVNQARYVTMRHENQPSLTGLVFLAHWTQHWFGAVPSFSSCTACMRRTVLGYYQVVPAGLCATNSCRSSGAGRECTSYRTVCV
jgi:hypothetical protein